MKKTCTLLLVMALLLAQFNSLPVHADELSGDFYYIENPDSTITITGYTDSAPRNHVMIPQMINGKTVTAIGDGAFQRKSIQSLELPDGLVSIGKRAFSKNLLTSLDVPGNVKMIEEGAFENNNLTSLTIHDGVEKIGIAAYIGNKITALSLPDSVTEINDNAFYGNRIASLVLPNSLVEIGDNSFYGNKLTAIDIPASVSVIGDSAFSGNRIVELVIPSTVTHLKSNAFHYNALTSVTFLGTPSLADASVFSNQFSDVTNSDMHNWYTDTAYTQAWNNTVTLPMTIYTAWKSNILSFNPKGGANVGNQFIGFGQKGMPVVSTKTEHTFAGWYKEKELINQWDFNTDTVIRNITLYAKWIANSYTVSFQSNGGTAVAAQTIDYNGTVVQPTNPSKAEYTFAGWYTNSGLTTPWNFGADQVKGNMTLYAKWTANTYTVDFQTNGGSAVANQTIAYDGKVASPANPSKEGHTFAGWYTNSGLTTAWNFDTGVVKGDMTLYAKWTANTYTIIFQSNGGSAVAAQTIAYDSKVAQPATPSRTEHTFEGWYTNSGLTSPWNFDTDLVKGAMRLYAKWTVNTYTVSFQPNGGSVVAAQTIAYDGKVVSPTKPSKPGYTFAGWYTNSGLTSAWNFGTGLVKGDMTLYAKWTVNTYTVSFQSNGGSAVADQTIAYDGKVASPANPSKAGHTFAGWYTNSGLTTAWNFGTGLVKGDMTLYAKWTVNTHTVSFQPNGGSTVAAQTIEHDGKVVSPTNPSKAGHTFAGWYTNSGLTSAWNFGTGLVKGDMILYAKWTVNTYTVSFQSNGGSAVAAQTIAYDGKVASPANPSKAGHTFAGWYTNTGLTTAWNFGTGLVKGDMTLYAKWTVNTYTVSFQANGGSAVAAQTIAYDSKVASPANPSKAGHTFAGWYTDEKLTTRWMFDTNVVTEDITLYAGWDKELYTVSFETSGGSDIIDQRIAFEESVVLPANPQKSGFTFAGWFKDEDLKLGWNFKTDVVTADTTLFAKWSKIIYVETPGPIIEPEPEPEPKPEEEPVQNVCLTRFTDISGHWAENAIRDITGRCIIIGYPDGEFKPNAPLIRAHVAVMLTRALELSPTRPLNSFNDVSNNSPYYGAILKASQAGIFEGANGYFYPNQQLTRAQMAKILVIAFNLPLGGKSTFQDVSSTHWASPYIAALESHGLTLGEDGYYKPEEPVTRAQFVAFMYRALHL